MVGGGREARGRAAKDREGEARGGPPQARLAPSLARTGRLELRRATLAAAGWAIATASHREPCRARWRGHTTAVWSSDMPQPSRVDAGTIWGSRGAIDSTRFRPLASGSVAAGGMGALQRLRPRTAQSRHFPGRSSRRGIRGKAAPDRTYPTWQPTHVVGRAVSGRSRAAAR